MDLSFDQQQAYDKIGDWIKNPDGKRVFNLRGYAGTGKTTIAKHLATQASGDVIFAAPTGKAAHVLRCQGLPSEVMTLHKLLYSPNGENPSVEKIRQEIANLKMEKADEKEIQKLRDKLHVEMKRNHLSFSYNPVSLLNTVALIIVDESSMVNDSVAEDLLRLNKPILTLGDPGQLPPVTGSGYFSRMEADWLLTEIHRQARDSPVIQLATMVRKGSYPTLGRYGTSEVVPRASITEAWAHPDAGQVLCGRNRTRIVWNKAIRRKRGYEGLLTIDERLICLKNNYDFLTWNGCIYKVVNIYSTGSDDRLGVDVLDDEGTELAFEIMVEDLRGNGAELTKNDREGSVEVTYGYTITVHKSQGSQWPSVQIIDESTLFGNTAQQHLYTAITRAQDRVTIAI